MNKYSSLIENIQTNLKCSEANVAGKTNHKNVKKKEKAKCQILKNHEIRHLWRNQNDK